MENHDFFNEHENKVEEIRSSSKDGVSTLPMMGAATGSEIDPFRTYPSTLPSDIVSNCLQYRMYSALQTPRKSTPH